MKRVLVVVLLAACGLIPAAAARADVQDLTIDPDVEFLDGDRVRVSGTITCDAGDRFRVGIPTGGLTTSTGTINERSGPDTGNCTGAAQTWRVVVHRDSGPPYQPGSTGTATARAQSGTPGDDEPNDTEVEASQPVTIN